jgi:hypothetical protein
VVVAVSVEVSIVFEKTLMAVRIGRVDGEIEVGFGGLVECVAGGIVGSVIRLTQRQVGQVLAFEGLVWWMVR